MVKFFNEFRLEIAVGSMLQRIYYYTCLMPFFILFILVVANDAIPTHYYLLVVLGIPLLSLFLIEFSVIAFRLKYDLSLKKNVADEWLDIKQKKMKLVSYFLESHMKSDNT